MPKNSYSLIIAHQKGVREMSKYEHKHRHFHPLSNYHEDVDYYLQVGKIDSRLATSLNAGIERFLNQWDSLMDDKNKRDPITYLSHIEALLSQLTSDYSKIANSVGNGIQSSAANDLAGRLKDHIDALQTERDARLNDWIQSGRLQIDKDF